MNRLDTLSRRGDEQTTFLPPLLPSRRIAAAEGDLLEIAFAAANWTNESVDGE
jgi:hypothetical protein